MTQVFADDDQVADSGMFSPMMPIPTQSVRPRPSRLVDVGPPSPALISFGPAIMPGKGVRRIRCVGCSHDTLPRNSDGAPLCQRCSELLATAGPRYEALPAPVLFRPRRWMRRRPNLG
jgi:hypothetical protein